MSFSGDFTMDTGALDKALRLGESFDLVGRNVLIGGKKGRFYFVDGFLKDEVMEKLLEFLMKITPEQLEGVDTAEQFALRFITYVEVAHSPDPDGVVTGVLSGQLALMMDGFTEAILMDLRTYPVRGVEEPEDDRVLRGSRDGFVETLVFNTALLRRRVRDPSLTMELFSIGTRSKTDVVVSYLSNRVDRKKLERLRKRLKAADVTALTMSQESLAEALIDRGWYNPFPKIRYTERPDAASACVMEGSILILVDNTPSVMILPTSIFDFFQESNDFYFPPLVGSYLRITRIVTFFLTLLLTPVWFLLVENPQYIPSWLDFIKISEPNSVPILFQLLVIEFAVDGLKLASLNTPSMLSNSFSVVGGLILGEFAVKAGWFVPDVILYMAFVSIVNFTQPSFELGYAFKLMRVLILILTALFNVWGFAAGLLVVILLLATNRTVLGGSYLYPLVPFDGHALKSLLIRKRLHTKRRRQRER